MEEPDGRELMPAGWTDISGVNYQESMNPPLSELWLSLDERERAKQETTPTAQSIPFPTHNYIEELGPTIRKIQDGTGTTGTGLEGLIIETGNAERVGQFKKVDAGVWTNYVNFDQVLTRAGHPGGWLTITYQEEIRAAILQIRDVMAELIFYTSIREEERDIDSDDGTDSAPAAGQGEFTAQLAWAKRFAQGVGVGLDRVFVEMRDDLVGPPNDWSCGQFDNLGLEISRAFGIIGDAEFEINIKKVVLLGAPTDDIDVTLGSTGEVATIPGGTGTGTTFETLTITGGPPGFPQDLTLKFHNPPVSTPLTATSQCEFYFDYPTRFFDVEMRVDISSGVTFG